MKGIVSIDENSSVALAVRKMVSKKVGSILISRDADYVGIVTERDILSKVLLRNLNPIVTEIGSVMSSPLITMDGETPIEKGAELMEEKDIRRLAVTEGGKVIGIVSASDIQRVMLRAFLEAGSPNEAIARL